MESVKQVVIGKRSLKRLGYLANSYDVEWVIDDVYDRMNLSDKICDILFLALRCDQYTKI